MYIPNNKILDLSELKAFTDKKIRFVLGRVDNTIVFKSLLSWESFKLGIPPPPQKSKHLTALQKHCFYFSVSNATKSRTCPTLEAFTDYKSTLFHKILCIYNAGQGTF